MSSLFCIEATNCTREAHEAALSSIESFSSSSCKTRAVEDYLCKASSFVLMNPVLALSCHVLRAASTPLSWSHLSCHTIHSKMERCRIMGHISCWCLGVILLLAIFEGLKYFRGLHTKPVTAEWKVLPFVHGVDCVYVLYRTLSGISCVCIDGMTQPRKMGEIIDRPHGFRALRLNVMQLSIADISLARSLVC